MPNIVEYSAPTSTHLEPTDMGERSITQAARAMRVLGDEQAQKIKAGVGEVAAAAGQLVKQYDHTDVTNTVSKFSDTINQQHEASTRFLKDPNLDLGDPAIADKFMQEQFEPAMDQVRSGIRTQAGQDAFNEHYNAFKVQFRQQFQRDLSTVAGVHADAAINNYFNQQSALIQQNPSALVPAMGVLDSTVKSMLDSSPNISAPDREKILDNMSQKAKTKYQETAIYAIGMNNPQAAMDAINKGEFPDINGPQANMAMKQMLATQRQQAAMASMEARQARQETQNANFGKFLSKFGDAIASGHVDPQLGVDALHQAGQGQMSGEHAITMYRLNEAALKHPNDSFDAAPSVLQDLNSRAALNPGDPNRLTDLELGKMAASQQIDMNTLKKYHEIIDLGLRDPVFRSDMQEFNKSMDSFKQMVAPTGGLMGSGADPGQLVKFNQYFQEKQGEFLKLRGTGMDVRDMLSNPSSQNYLFRDIARAGIDPKDAAANTLRALSLTPGSPYVPHLQPPERGGQMDQDLAKQGFTPEMIDVILGRSKK